MLEPLAVMVRCVPRLPGAAAIGWLADDPRVGAVTLGAVVTLDDVVPPGRAA